MPSAPERAPGTGRAAPAAPAPVPVRHLGAARCAAAAAWAALAPQGAGFADPRAEGPLIAFLLVAVTAPVLRRRTAAHIPRRGEAVRGETREAWRPNWTR